MKYFNSSIYTLALSLFAVTTLNAQTTIVELDGANGEFVVNDWTLTGPNAFASDANGIVIDDGESGALAINNTNLYSNISVEIEFVNTNISF